MRLGSFRWLSVILSAGPMFAASCESLRSLPLPHAMVTSVQTVRAGEFTALESGGRGRGPGDSFQDLPAFCRVAITATPSADSDIKVEVWLPAAQWNGKFLAAGVGGGASAALQGSMNFSGLAGALRRGFATATTDTGHSGATLSYAIDHPERLMDFGYRAVHEMTVDAKAVIAAYYGDAPKSSYWNGCAAASFTPAASAFPGPWQRIYLLLICVSRSAANWALMKLQD